MQFFKTLQSIVNFIIDLWRFMFYGACISLHNGHFLYFLQATPNKRWKLNDMWKLLISVLILILFQVQKLGSLMYKAVNFEDAPEVLNEVSSISSKLSSVNWEPLFCCRLKFSIFNCSISRPQSDPVLETLIGPYLEAFGAQLWVTLLY